MNERKLNVRLSDARHRQLKQSAVDRGQTIQELIEEILEMGLGSLPPAAERIQIDVPRDIAAQVERYASILRSADGLAADHSVSMTLGIIRNLFVLIEKNQNKQG